MEGSPSGDRAGRPGEDGGGAFADRPVLPRPFALQVLMAALAFQGLSAVAGGIVLLADPTGAALGLPLAWLEGSPFRDYAIPGLVLLTALGVGPLWVVYGLWLERAWSWTGALLVGLALLGWLAVEIAVVGYQPQPPLQLLYGLVGALVVALCLLPSVRRRLRRGR